MNLNLRRSPSRDEQLKYGSLISLDYSYFVGNNGEQVGHSFDALTNLPIEFKLGFGSISSSKSGWRKVTA